ncbi:hypothetical protein EX30DRAFT_342167 [Ascodesmis nigricans]|uniref:Uncharacterized protein n=1 Tax=Ascodesmis nigricans TaxID=341454 RepID=A0A4S2MTM2_9PEZI|nr:hypothetical protein EX30DRAFT_342167 [Ascodesmis nigricans]
MVSLTSLLTTAVVALPMTVMVDAYTVRYCKDTNFGGDCYTDIGCVNLPAAYSSQVSSIFVEDGFTCVFYTVPDCNPPSAHARRSYPGGSYANLAGYDNTFKSYYCYKPATP